MVGLTLGLAPAQTGAQTPRKTVMAVDFANRTAGWSGTSQAVTDRVIAKLREDQSVRVLSRDEAQKALQDAKAETSGLLDSEQAQRVAKTLGADYAIMGEVTAFDQEQHGGCVPIAGCVYTNTATVALHGKVLNVASGQFLADPKAEAKKSQRSGSVYAGPWWGSVSMQNFHSQLVGKATLEAVDKFVGEAKPHLK